ncbi:VOC family protein [Paeniglutamicibacter sp. Y32M11]|uniref:VOC family protein n=1 Tax=Paeniglutamicibacter sp. Y32M11 TaxID=2853258 RepID=UPI001C530ABC|nr:VOC family protein [Paeniglutamicibacter sp. Y32M11]QXQ11828.1 VOC family protein [Paeniglutamicibacter sp. Y32M11]
MSLSNSPLTTIIPVTDTQRSQKFYEDLLGLSYRGRAADGNLLFALDGTGTLALLSDPEAKASVHTAASFEVNDISGVITELSGRGVVFEDYDLPDLKTTEHVCVLGSEKAAWFRDPDGNILCLHENLG